MSISFTYHFLCGHVLSFCLVDLFQDNLSYLGDGDSANSYFDKKDLKGGGEILDGGENGWGGGGSCGPFLALCVAMLEVILHVIEKNEQDCDQVHTIKLLVRVVLGGWVER